MIFKTKTAARRNQSICCITDCIPSLHDGLIIITLEWVFPYSTPSSVCRNLSKFWTLRWNYKYGNCYTFNDGVDDQETPLRVLQSSKPGPSQGMVFIQGECEGVGSVSARRPIVDTFTRLFLAWIWDVYDFHSKLRPLNLLILDLFIFSP